MAAKIFQSYFYSVEFSYFFCFCFLGRKENLINKVLRNECQVDFFIKPRKEFVGLLNTFSCLEMINSSGRLSCYDRGFT